MTSPLGVFRPHDRVAVFFPEQGRTQQSFKSQCDVNNIMARFEQTGTIEHANTYRGLYEDFSEVGDYHTLCNQVVRARDMFMGLPASVRKQFSNDPGTFLDFAQDPENADAMVEMGLMRPEDHPEASKKKAAHAKPTGEKKATTTEGDGPVGPSESGGAAA